MSQSVTQIAFGWVDGGDDLWIDSTSYMPDIPLTGGPRKGPSNHLESRRHLPAMSHQPVQRERVICLETDLCLFSVNKRASSQDLTLRTHSQSLFTIRGVLCHRSVSRRQRFILFCKSFIKLDFLFAVRRERLVVGPVRIVSVRVE